MKIKYLFLLILCFLSVQWGQAQKNTETRPLKSFKAFNFYGAAKIYLIQGDEEKITLAGKRNIDVKKITTEIRQGKLYITSKRPKALLNPRLKIHIYFKNLEQIDIEGKAKITSQKPIKGEKLEIIVKGSARTYLDMDVRKFKAHLMGAGGINVKGNAKYQSLTVDGAGAIRAANLKGIEARAQINGAGNILVHAIGKLRAGISGVGTIRYKGNPVQTNFSSEGVGSIAPID